MSRRLRCKIRINISKEVDWKIPLCQCNRSLSLWIWWSVERHVKESKKRKRTGLCPVQWYCCSSNNSRTIIHNRPCNKMYWMITATAVPFTIDGLGRCSPFAVDGSSAHARMPALKVDELSVEMPFLLLHLPLNRWFCPFFCFWNQQNLNHLNRFMNIVQFHRDSLFVCIDENEQRFGWFNDVRHRFDFSLFTDRPIEPLCYHVVKVEILGYH